MACIALKYGSFTDLDHPRLTNGQVAKELNCSVKRVYQIVQRYTEVRSFHRINESRGRKRRQFSAEHLHAIVSTEALESQKFMSLKQRLDYFLKEHGLKLNELLLRNIYKRHGISYR